MARAPNAFAASPLDRQDARRRDTGWIEAQKNSGDARFVPVWRSRNLVRRTSEKRFEPAYLTRQHIRQDAPWAFLGSYGATSLFAADLSAWDHPIDTDADGTFEDLRRMGSLLPAEDAAILAHARGLMHWRSRHRFCPTCGANAVPRDAGHVMQCNGCGAHHFPRTDPAVIMLVTHENRALLGQPARFRETRFFTTLAGFVEPGESLEEAVAREVFEEAGVRVANIAYHSSQPWPFPASIMLGFTAEATTADIVIDPDELVDARWFTRAEAASEEGFFLPPAVSIARRLIDDWIVAKP
jgi:NAD+ diphosphatase